MPFQPGQSGNPAGRPRGSRNKATVIAEKLLGDSAGELTRAAIARALDGDPAALRACMDRIAPRLRHRPLDFDLPQLVTLADAPPAINAIAQGLAHGELDIEEAAILLRAVREFTRALAAVERETRAAGLAAQAVDAARAAPRASPETHQLGRIWPRQARSGLAHVPPNAYIESRAGAAGAARAGDCSPSCTINADGAIIIMPTKRAILAASAVALLGSGLIMPDTASARRHTGHLPLVLGHTYGYAPGRAPRYQYVPAGPPQGIYDSLSNGQQPYANPDRDFSGPNANFYGN